MELLKVIFICIFLFPMNQESLSQNVDRREFSYHTLKDQDKHVQKREHQGLIPHLLKLGQPITLPIQGRPQTVQEARTQMIPRQSLHEMPHALQQRLQTVQQRPINLRLDPAANLHRRVTYITKNPVHNNTTKPSVKPNHEVPKDFNEKTAVKHQTVLTPVSSDSVVHISIPKETPDNDESHETVEFFEDKDDEEDNRSMYHPEILKKTVVNGRRINKLERKDHSIDEMATNRKPIKMNSNKSEIKTTSDHDDTIYDKEITPKKVKTKKNSKVNDMEKDQNDVRDEEQLQEIRKDDQNTEKKTTLKQPILKTTNKADKNKFKTSLMHTLTRNNYTGDNIISVKAQKDENRIQDSKPKENTTSTQLIQNDKKDNVLIQNRAYEEVYEKSINSEPSILSDKSSSNIQTPEYTTYSEKYQDVTGENKFPIYSYNEDNNLNSNRVPSTNIIQCEYNRHTNSYENDPNLFHNKDTTEPSIEYKNENKICSGISMNINDDYYPKESNNYIDRMWRTWRNSEVHINNNINKPNNENMDKLELPNQIVDYKKKEPVIPITNGNVIGVNAYYKNQNKPVTCPHYPNYQCYY